MSISLLLWDFGDTLVDERWMRRAPASCPSWEDAWLEVMAARAADWDVGAATAAEVYEAVAVRTGMAVPEVEAHAVDCCRRIGFHPTAWRFATERHRPQALVTVNPDLFVDVVVPLHDLTSVFDAIVASATAGTSDKVELCELALDRLGFRGPRSEALLIDNRADLVQAWVDAGGAGYWFPGDEQFGRDVPTLLDQP